MEYRRGHRGIAEIINASIDWSNTSHPKVLCVNPNKIDDLAAAVRRMSTSKLPVTLFVIQFVAGNKEPVHIWASTMFHPAVKAKL